MSMSPGRSLSREQPGAGGDPIVIGLVNNMPDTALRTTERQFSDLLSAASQECAIRLRLFSLPEIPRGNPGREHVSQNHEDISALWTSRLDGLIVTGTEPRAPALPDEPYWPTLTKLVDWSDDHTTSTVWSCLAAHAAVLHIDGIDRYALPEKLSGVFDCTKAAHHPITVGAPSRWRIPHSRYNGLPMDTLASRGYLILSKSPDVGADMFVKQGKSLFLFLQGHPEYDAGALLREYRRDVGRFLAGERDRYPEMPRGYFDDDTASAFAAFRQKALQSRHIDLLSQFPFSDAERKLTPAWRSIAVRIYANWLSYLAERRNQCLGSTEPRSSARAVAI